MEDLLPPGLPDTYETRPRSRSYADTRGTSRVRMNEHPMIRRLRAVLIIQSAFRGRRARGWVGRARLDLRRDSDYRDVRIKMGIRRANNELRALLNAGSHEVLVRGGNTAAARLGKQRETAIVRVLVHPLGSIIMEGSSWTLLTLLYVVVIGDSNHLYPVLVPCFCVHLISHLLRCSMMLDLTLAKYCYRSLVSWVNLINALRWFVAYLVVSEIDATKVIVGLTITLSVALENFIDAWGFALWHCMLVVLNSLSFCVMLYIASDPGADAAADGELLGAKLVTFFANTSMAFAVDFVAEERTSLQQLIFFLATDLCAFAVMAWKLRTLRVPPYRSVRLRVPIRLRVDHEWSTQLADQKLARKMALLFGEGEHATNAALEKLMAGTTAPQPRTTPVPSTTPRPAQQRAESVDGLTLAQRARVLLGVLGRKTAQPPRSMESERSANMRGSVSADI